MLKILLKALYSKCGATSVEYAIMPSLIAAIIFGAVMTLGLKVMSLFEPLEGAF